MAVSPPPLRRLVARFGTRPWAAGGVFCLLLLRTLLDIAPPFLIGHMLDVLATGAAGGGDLPEAYATGLVLLGAVFALKLAVFYAAQVSAAAIGQDLENGFRADLFRQVMRLRFAYHDENRAGATIARSLRDMDKARHFFREVWFGYLEIGLLLIAVLAGTYATDVAYGAIVTVVFGLAVTATILVGRRIAGLDRAVSDDYDHVSTVLQENVAGAQVVRAFGLERAEEGRFDRRMDRFSRGWLGLERFWTGWMPGIGNLYRMAMPFLIAIGGWRVASGAGTVGEIATVLLYVRTVEFRLRPFTRLVILGQQAVASAGRIHEVLDDARHLPVPADPAPLPATGGHVCFEDVAFAYRGGSPVLRDVTLDVPAGTTLGLLGPTGSGKTTLVSLLPRFRDPDAGRVLLDGRDVREVDGHALRRAVALVAQEPFLFSATVAENVAYGRPDASRAEIEAALERAAALDFVRELPDGLDTMVGERGVSLSGGQRQRLTIARALAARPRVLVLDDATAAVDAVTERRLVDGIRAATEEQTVIVISQRVPSVRWCDRIAVLDDGRIEAVGTHEELLERSPLYAEIASHQRLEGIVP